MLSKRNFFVFSRERKKIDEEKKEEIRRHSVQEDIQFGGLPPCIPSDFLKGKRK